MQFKFEDLISKISSRNHDVVFLIDTTTDMKDVIGNIKNAINHFYEENLKTCQYLYKNDPSQYNLRVRTIWFGGAGKQHGDSGFLILPEEGNKFNRFLESIEIGKDEGCVEECIDTVLEAMKADWVQTEGIKRHIIVLFTKASVHSPEKPNESILKKVEEFQHAWLLEDDERIRYPHIRKYSRQLVVFSPYEYPWNELETTLDYLIPEDIARFSNGEPEPLSNLIACIHYY